MPSPSYIVTGGAGFVGSNLIAQLLRQDPSARITVVDNFRSGSYANITEACERSEDASFRGLFEGRVIPQSSSQVNWPALLASTQAHTIFHLGAITDTTLTDEAEMLRENTWHFGAMLDAAQDSSHCTALVYASSAATYGTLPHTHARAPFPESAAGKPNNVYGFSKWMMEQEHLTFHKRTHTQRPNIQRPVPLHIVGLRYFNVFGPGESRKRKMASMVYQLAQQMLAGERPRLFEFGDQARDQVPVQDVVACTLHAANPTPNTSPNTNPAPRPGIYNLGSATATTYNTIVDALYKGLAIAPSSRPIDYIPMPPHIRAFYQDFTQADMTSTAQNLNWKPTHSPYDCMVRYAQFLRQQHAITPPT
jgi:ADP-L-glycero-D-manno-heptose 6-epimerase